MNVKKLFTTSIITLAIAIAGSAAVYALPSVDEVVSGDVNIQSDGSTMTFNVVSNKAIINLDSFDIGTHETVNFNGPNSEVLARVTGGNASYINGNLYSNCMSSNQMGQFSPVF